MVKHDTTNNFAGNTRLAPSKSRPLMSARSSQKKNRKSASGGKIVVGSKNCVKRSIAKTPTSGASHPGVGHLKKRDRKLLPNSAAFADRGISNGTWTQETWNNRKGRLPAARYRDRKPELTLRGRGGTAYVEDEIWSSQKGKLLYESSPFTRTTPVKRGGGFARAGKWRWFLWV